MLNIVEEELRESPLRWGIWYSASGVEVGWCTAKQAPTPFIICPIIHQAMESLKESATLGTNLHEIIKASSIFIYKAVLLSYVSVNNSHLESDQKSKMCTNT